MPNHRLDLCFIHLLPTKALPHTNVKYYTCQPCSLAYFYNTEAGLGKSPIAPRSLVFCSHPRLSNMQASSGARHTLFCCCLGLCWLLSGFQNWRWSASGLSVHATREDKSFDRVRQGCNAREALESAHVAFSTNCNTRERLRCQPRIREKIKEQLRFHRGTQQYDV